MCSYDELMSRTLCDMVAGMSGEEAVAHLMNAGLLNRRSCEREVVKREVARLQGEGLPRCESLIVAAERCCCSYEKARTLFYERINQPTVQQLQ